MSIILGVDPGSRQTGFGILEVKSNGELRPRGYGVIMLDPNQSFPERMKELSEALQALMLKHKPDVVSVEKIFLGKNADSAFKLGHARGVVLAEAARSQAQVFEYATRVVKKSLTGKGSSGKEEVLQMVRRFLRVPELQQIDASDALALAIHHAFVLKSNRLSQWQETAT